MGSAVSPASASTAAVASSSARARPSSRCSERAGLLLCENDHLSRAAREAGEGPVEAPACVPAGGPAALVALDDLVHALVAEAEALGDLAQRAAFGMEAPNRVAVVGSGALERVLGLEHAIARVARFAESRGIQGRHGV